MNKEHIVRLQSELDRVKEKLWRHQSITDKQYCEMYAIQQALTWALDPASAAPPFDVVMDHKVWPPPGPARERFILENQKGD